MDPTNVELARQRCQHERLSFVEGEAPRVLPPGPFSVIVMSNVLEHIERRVEFLTEVQARLAPERWLIRVPMFNRDWRPSLRRELGLFAYSDPTHFTEYTRESFEAEMADAGLQVTHLQVNWGEVWAVASRRGDVNGLKWEECSVLVTGGTGSFGRKFVERILQKRPRKVIVFSRDELKQHEMWRQFPDDREPALRYFIGDVRDVDRLHRAFHDVDVVVHAAALKQVPACEYNPIEAVNTNILGARNIIEAAIDQGVKRVIALSTDKAVSPVNMYGATKLVAEKLFVQGNSYVGTGRTRFSCVRYGNVVGSRGSRDPAVRAAAVDR